MTVSSYTIRTTTVYLQPPLKRVPLKLPFSGRTETVGGVLSGHGPLWKSVVGCVLSRGVTPTDLPVGHLVNVLVGSRGDLPVNGDY